MLFGKRFCVSGLASGSEDGKVASFDGRSRAVHAMDARILTKGHRSATIDALLLTSS